MTFIIHAECLRKGEENRGGGAGQGGGAVSDLREGAASAATAPLHGAAGDANAWAPPQKLGIRNSVDKPHAVFHQLPAEDLFIFCSLKLVNH